MYMFMAMSWYSLIFFENRHFSYRPILGRMLSYSVRTCFLLFWWLINSWLLFSISVCVFLRIFVLFSWMEKNLKALSRITASVWTRIQSWKFWKRKIALFFVFFCFFLQCCNQGEKTARKSSCSWKKQSTKSMKHVFAVTVFDFMWG